MLELAMRRVQALELLANPEHVGRLTMGGIHKLLLKAGYPPEIAEKEASRHGWDRLCAGEVL